MFSHVRRVAHGDWRWFSNDDDNNNDSNNEGDSKILLQWKKCSNFLSVDMDENTILWRKNANKRKAKCVAKAMKVELMKLFEWILSAIESLQHTKLFALCLSLEFDRFDVKNIRFDWNQRSILVSSCDWSTDFIDPIKLTFMQLLWIFSFLLFLTMAKCWKLCNQIRGYAEMADVRDNRYIQSWWQPCKLCLHKVGLSGVIFVYVRHLRCLIVFCVLNVYRCVCFVECLFSFRFLLFWFFSRLLLVFVVVRYSDNNSSIMYIYFQALHCVIRIK